MMGAAGEEVGGWGEGRGGFCAHVTDAPFRSLHFGGSRRAERKVRILKENEKAEMKRLVGVPPKSRGKRSAATGIWPEATTANITGPLAVKRREMI